MSADRFEVDLRELLRSEAATAPVTMELATLKARAGRRSRWPWAAWPRAAQLATAGGGIAAVALAVALAVVNAPRSPDVAASPTPPANGSVAPSAPAPSVAPSIGPSAIAFDPGPSGSFLVARIEADAITIVSVLRDGTERVAGRIDGLAGLTAIASDAHLEDDAVQAIGPNGDVLVTVSSGDGDTAKRTNVIARVGGTFTIDRVVPDGRGTFGPDGTLVINEINASGVTVVYRVDPSGLAALPPVERIQQTIPSEGISVDGNAPVLVADGSGIVAGRDKGDGSSELVVLTWDGATRPLTATEAIWQPTGTERVRGANDEQISGGCDSVAGGATGGCVLILLRPGQDLNDGKNIAFDQFAWDNAAWMPDGRTVVMGAMDGVAYWDGATTRKVNTLPESFRTSGGTIDGILGTGTAGAALVGSFDGTTIVPLDGSPILTVPGRLLQVVP